MKIIWMYRVLADGRTHITTWRETHKFLKQRHGHDIHYVFAYSDSPSCFTDQAVLIKKLRWPGFAFMHFLIFGFGAFMRLNRQVRPDVIIFDQFTALYSLIFIGRKSKPILLLDLRQAKYSQKGAWYAGSFLKAYTKLILRLNRRFHDGITYISDALRRQVLRDMDIDLHPQFLVWPSGVDTELFRPSVSNKSLPEQTPSEQTPLKLFFHGSITADRGLTESLQAIALWRERGRAAKLTIVGSGSHLPRLQAIATDLGIIDSVDFKKSVPYQDVPALIDAADVCLMTYPASEYWEGNVPIKLLEYMAMEKVTLCTDLQVFRDITRNAPCAHIIPDNSPREIVNGLDFLCTNRQQFRAWGKSGRLIVMENYTWESISRDIDAFLNRLAKSETKH